MPCSSDEALGASTSGSHCRRAPRTGAAISCRIVRQLLQHPGFHFASNPNRARSLIFSYCNANPGAFHRARTQAGYVFWSRTGAWSWTPFNPQVAARLARALDRWKKLADPWRTAAREAIARVAAREGPEQRSCAKWSTARCLIEFERPRNCPMEEDPCSKRVLVDPLPGRASNAQRRPTSRPTCACCWRWLPAPANASAWP
jgi:hypothetical protein